MVTELDLTIWLAIYLAGTTAMISVALVIIKLFERYIESEDK